MWRRGRGIAVRLDTLCSNRAATYRPHCSRLSPSVCSPEVMAKRKRKKAESQKPSSKQKGDLVEHIVAMMHELDPQITVRRDVRLPAKHNGKRSRQIDVLLLGQFTGYPTVLAIECKNYSRPVNVGDIGRFRDHLDDVGLSSQQGILVSASAIGSGALDRAQELGMKVYELSGLTLDQLSESVHETSQLMIFMVPAYSGLTLEYEVAQAGMEESMTVFDEDGNVVAYLPDLIWLKWLAGEPPSVLGEHELDLGSPEGWHTEINGRRHPIPSASAKVRVHAAVVALPGTASNFAMINPEDRSVTKLHSRLSFENAPGEYPVFNVSEESELERFIQSRPEAVRLTIGRMRVPRILVNYIYWPPSARVKRRMAHLEKFFLMGRLRMPHPEDLKGLEGNDLKTVWEPIAKDHPALELLQTKDG
jgi:Restriction endonuclease